MSTHNVQRSTRINRHRADPRGAENNRLSMSKKKPLPFGNGLFEIKAWRCPTLTWGDPTLPSALSVFTSEFEMESGGSHSLLPPGKLFIALAI
jgi:hypothetical protein